ncbi:tyrosine-type recombinase/integrase [Komagataeibacter swingsii]|uniref:tyrosine-type recombinase/integrase n=1 Tax=Komagataeibacter swingsii TaxID=215220 RepID=UPI001FC9999C|nr:site-specific integrase [Komagataeibacter swingsii]GBQ63188.1 phage integrase [Komagataeibacter swingsii DSM 16373]
MLEQAPCTGFLFPNRDGNPYRNAASNYGQIMRRVAARCEATGIPFARFRIHDFRHAFAIRWLKAGGDIYRLSRHLGHTSVKTTEIYLSALTADELDHMLHVGTKVGTAPP